MDTMSKIVELLQESGKEQKDFCADIGVSPTTFSNWKSGLSSSYFKYLPAIAEYFKVSVDYLVSNSTDKEKAEPDRQALLDEMFRLYDLLSDAQKAEFIPEFLKIINKHK